MQIKISESKLLDESDDGCFKHKKKVHVSHRGRAVSSEAILLYNSTRRGCCRHPFFLFFSFYPVLITTIRHGPRVLFFAYPSYPGLSESLIWSYVAFRTWVCQNASPGDPAWLVDIPGFIGRSLNNIPTALLRVIESTSAFFYTLPFLFRFSRGSTLFLNALG